MNFQYYTPTRIIFGKDTHLQVADIIKEYGFKKVLVHYGKNSVIKSGLLSTIIKLLDKNEISHIEFGGVEPNPKISMVREGVKICKENDIDLILAVGGGSVIDSAKLIAIGAVYDNDPWDFSTKKAVAEKSLPVATILTLAASGSEMSDSCVITNEDGMLKRGFGSLQNKPLFSICNPCLTYSVDKYQTACGAVDIMMHTIERYFTTSEPFSVSDEMAEGILRTVIKYARTAIENPCDYEARANLMWAGSLSHNGLTGAGTEFMMVCHQFEHELSGKFDCVAHGAGLAVIFPAWAKYIYKYNTERFAKFATNVWGISACGKTNKEVALQGILKTEEFFKSLGMPTTYSELGITVTDDDIEDMSIKCTNFGTRTLKDYINLDKNKITKIFKIAGGDSFE